MKLVLHPEFGISVLMDDGSWMTYTEAKDAYPKEVQDLMDTGAIDFEWKPEEKEFPMNPPEEEPRLPNPEQAVCDEKAIADSVVTEPDGEIPEEQVTHNPMAFGLPTSMVELIPEECKGEVNAFTYEPITLDDVTGDFYCIEEGWEQRGDYFMIGVKPASKVLVHSDKLKYHAEFPWLQ